jgi:predicted amidophosphoribosyltransferase
MTTNEAELSGAVPPWGRGLRRALAALADLLLPPVCISCRKQTLAHGLLCGACWSRIDFIASPICARLGVTLDRRDGAAGGGNRRAASLSNCSPIVLPKR